MLTDTTKRHIQHIGYLSSIGHPDVFRKFMLFIHDLAKTNQIVLDDVNEVYDIFLRAAIGDERIGDNTYKVNISKIKRIIQKAQEDK